MPTVYALLPDSKPHFLDSAGDPLSGGQLFVYVAGSSTKATTYTESDGLTANANPIVLDSRGEPPNGVYAATGSYKLVLAPSNDTDPPASAIWTRDDVTPINDVANATATEWSSTGLTPTYVSGTQFTLVGDQTTDHHVGRRIKATVSGGTVYGYISVSAYTSLTTVTVVLDSGALDAGLSDVQLGFLRSDDSSIPHVVTASTGLTVSGALTAGKTFIQKQGSDVVSASALPINVDGNLFDVTGTTTVTSLASKGVGTVVVLQFDDALTLTHHATDLILPGGQNITTAAGDIATFYEYASGDWRCINYERAGSVIRSGTTVTLTNQTTVDFTVPTWVKWVRFMFSGVSTNGTDSMLLQLGDGGGIEATGYIGSNYPWNGTPSTSTTGFLVSTVAAGTDVLSGVAEVVLLDAATFSWACRGDVARSDAAGGASFAGSKALSAAITTIRLTAGGTDQFDAGTVNIQYG